MSAETDLLPLPSVLLNWPHPTNHAAIRDYARANLAELQREVEGLRAEVEKWRSTAVFGACGLSDHLTAMEERATAAEARAERLAEALRRLTGAAYPVCTTIDPRGHRWCEPYLDEALPDARAALDQENDDA